MNKSAFAAMAFEDRERAIAFGFVVDAGKRVAGSERFAIGGCFEKFLRIDGCEFRHPAFDVDPLRVVARGLGPWVLDAEIGCRIGASAGRPLPAAVV